MLNFEEGFNFIPGGSRQLRVFWRDFFEILYGFSFQNTKRRIFWTQLNSTNLWISKGEYVYFVKKNLKRRKDGRGCMVAETTLSIVQTFKFRERDIRWMWKWGGRKRNCKCVDCDVKMLNCCPIPERPHFLNSIQ